MWEKAPVDELHFTWSINKLFLREGCSSGAGAKVVELGITLFSAIITVIDFSGRIGGVAICFEMLRESGKVFIGIQVSKPGCESIDAGGIWAESHHEAGTRGITKW